MSNHKRLFGYNPADKRYKNSNNSMNECYTYVDNEGVRRNFDGTESLSCIQTLERILWKDCEELNQFIEGLGINERYDLD